MSQASFDARALRDAFGAFPTGVTVVTAHDPSGQPIGFTANSFTSVSLDPPLLLICLAKSSRNFAAITGSAGFAVNILSETQKDVSNTFARPVEDRFAAVEWEEGTARFANLCRCRGLVRLRNRTGGGRGRPRHHDRPGQGIRQ